MDKENLVALKYPLRWLIQFLLMIEFIYSLIKILNGNFKEIDIILFAVACVIEFYFILYSLRNKTFYIVDNLQNKYIIKAKNLEKEDEILKNFNYRAKAFINFYDILNLMGILETLSEKEELKEKIKRKIYLYPKYKIKSVYCYCDILGIKLYRIVFCNDEIKILVTTNNI